MSAALPDARPVVGQLDIVTRPLRPYLDDRRVIEILLNMDGRLWVDRAGEGMVLTETVLTPDDAEIFLRFVATESQATVTRSKPSLAGTLPHWGARVQGLIPPVVKSPIFAIRKPAALVFSLGDYVDKGVITEAQKAALTRAVLERCNILVGGGTGTGKTTFCNALLRVMAEQTRDRLHIIEDNAELQCLSPNHNIVRTTRNEYDTLAAVYDALRLRPDRIIVGELRDGTAHVLLKGWRTGHPGGVATLHADSTSGMLDRIADLSEEHIHPANRSAIASTVNVCVHLTLDPTSNAGRRLSGIDRVLGYDRRAERWLLEPLV